MKIQRSKHVIGLITVTVLLIGLVIFMKWGGEDSPEQLAGREAKSNSHSSGHMDSPVDTTITRSCGVFTKIRSPARQDEIEVCVHRQSDWRAEVCEVTGAARLDLEWSCSSDVERYVISAQSLGYAQLAPAIVALRAGDFDEVTLDLVAVEGHLSGNVLDSTGGPVEGALVRALCEELQDSWEGESRGFGLSAEDGSFRLPLGRSCTWDKVVATAPGYTEGYAEILTPTAPLRVVLSPGATIAGVVVLDGEPVRGAKVSLHRDGRSGIAFRHATLQDTSDAEGRFEIHGVSPGRWVSIAEKDNLRGTGQSTLLVDVGEAITNVEISVQEFAGVHVTVRGRDDSSVDPVCDGAVAELLLKGDLSTIQCALGVIKGGVVDYRGVPPGQYVVSAACRGLGNVESEPFAVTSTEQLVSVPLEARAGSRLSGRVINADGDPIEGILVGVVGEHGRIFERTDTRGQFVFLGLTAGSQATLEVVESTGERTTRAIEIGRDDDLDIEIGERVLFTGKVVSTGSVGVANTTVHVMVGSESVGQCATSMSGHFQCPARAEQITEAGTRLEARRDDDVLGEQVGEPGQPAIISTRLGDIRGRVLDFDGREASFAVVQLQELDGDKRRVSGTATADVSGEFTLAGTQRGRDYIVVAKTSDGRRAERLAHTGNHVEIELPRAMTLNVVISGCGLRHAGQIRLKSTTDRLNLSHRYFTLATDPATLTIEGLQQGIYDAGIDVGDCGSRTQEVSITPETPNWNVQF